MKKIIGIDIIRKLDGKSLKSMLSVYDPDEIDIVVGGVYWKPGKKSL